MPDHITFAAPMPWSLLNLCHPRSMFRLPPVARHAPFAASPPWHWTSNSCSLFLDTRLVAPHCLSSSVFWRFRVRRLWSSLRCHFLACMRLVAAGSFFCGGKKPLVGKVLLWVQASRRKRLHTGTDSKWSDTVFFSRPPKGTQVKPTQIQ